MLVDEEFWSIQRRFSLRTMRRLGTLGKLSNEMEELMKKEIVLLMDRIRLSGSVQEFKHLFSVPFLNVLWGLLGNRQNAECRPDHAHMEALVKLIDFITQSGDIVRAALPIPSILLQMFPNLFAKMGRMDLMEPVWAFINVPYIFFFSNIFLNLYLFIHSRSHFIRMLLKNTKILPAKPTGIL